MRQIRNTYNNYSENLEIRNHLEDLGIDGKVTCKLILLKKGVQMWTGLNLFRIGPTGGFL